MLRLLESGLRDRSALEATDHLGVVNRFWLVTDPGRQTAVQGLMSSRRVFIADGHHRYETGLKYRDLLSQAGEIGGADDPANFCMMMLVGMSDPGLLILPTHRLVSGFPGLDSEELTRRLSPEFEIQPAGMGPAGCRAAWETIAKEAAQDRLGLGTASDGAWLLRGCARTRPWTDSPRPTAPTGGPWA